MVDKPSAPCIFIGSFGPFQGNFEEKKSQIKKLQGEREREREREIFHLVVLVLFKEKKSQIKKLQGERDPRFVLSRFLFLFLLIYTWGYKNLGVSNQSLIGLMLWLAEPALCE